MILRKNDSNKRRSPAVPRRVQEQVSRTQVFSYQATSRQAHQESENRAQQQLRRKRRLSPETMLSINNNNWLKHLQSFGRKMSHLTLIGIVLLGSLIILRVDKNAEIIPLSNANAHGSRMFLRKTSVYQQAFSEHIGNNSIVNSNKLTIDTNKISQELRKQFPELNILTISLPIIGNRPSIYVRPSVPVLILNTNSGLFVVGDSGRALLPVNQVEGLAALKLPVITDQSGLKFKLGAVVLPRSEVIFIREVIGQLVAANLHISSVTLPKASSELRVRLDGEGYDIRFNIQGNAKLGAGSYVAARKKIIAEKVTVREYVDVRVPNRVYFK